MSTYALPPRIGQRSPRKKPLSERVEIGITTVLVIIGLLLTTISLSYLFYANEKATQDYHLRILQEKRSKLVSSNEILSMQIADLESLAALEKSPKIQDMVAMKNPLYLRGNSAVARTPDTN
jgi:hypothetical protein